MGEIIYNNGGKNEMEKESNIHGELSSWYDNPLDSIASGVIDVLLDVIHASHRLRSEKYVDALKTDVVKIRERMEDINVWLTSLQRLSDDTIEVVKETSFFHDKDNSMLITTILNEVSSRIPVCGPNKVGPCHNVMFDKYRLGETSEIYKRMTDMRSLVTQTGESNDLTLRNLRDMLSVLRGNIDQLELPEESIIILCDKIKKYNLSESDINYLISYVTYHRPECSGKSKDITNTKTKTHITNFPKEDYKVYLAAVQIYNKFGKCVLSLSDKAYDSHGNLLNDHSSLHLFGNRDDFKFSELEECLSVVRGIAKGLNK